jgi:hypothetical protein
MAGFPADPERARDGPANTGPAVTSAQSVLRLLWRLQRHVRFEVMPE